MFILHISSCGVGLVLDLDWLVLVCLRIMVY